MSLTSSLPNGGHLGFLDLTKIMKTAKIDRTLTETNRRSLKQAKKRVTSRKVIFTNKNRNIPFSEKPVFDTLEPQKYADLAPYNSVAKPRSCYIKPRVKHDNALQRNVLIESPFYLLFLKVFHFKQFTVLYYYANYFMVFFKTHNYYCKILPTNQPFDKTKKISTVHNQCSSTRKSTKVLA